MISSIMEEEKLNGGDTFFLGYHYGEKEAG
jgi:hypothetical protein